MPPTLIGSVECVVRSLIAALPAVRFVRATVRLHLPEVRAPSLATGVFLESLLFGSAVLKPYLNHSHVETRLRAELFADVPRRFRAFVIGFL